MVKRQAARKKPEMIEARFRCSICGREISEEDNSDYDGMCWECWDDQLTEESDTLFEDLA